MKGPVKAPYQPLALLSDDQVEAFHQASLRVLQETGIQIMSGQARGYYRDAGAEVEEESERVRLAPELVEKTFRT